MAQLTKATADKAAELLIGIGAAQQAIDALQSDLSKIKTTATDYQEQRGALETKIGDWMRQRDNATLALYTLENAEMKAAEIRIISTGKKTAQVVIKTTDENGKKASMTRHLQLEFGNVYRGHSLLGLRIVRYDMNQIAANTENAAKAA